MENAILVSAVIIGFALMVGFAAFGSAIGDGIIGSKAVESIARVPGVDVLFIGPGDLSQGLGHPGAATHPDVQAAIHRIVRAGRAAGVPVGILALTPEDVETYHALGATVFMDSLPRLLLQACREQVKKLRDAAYAARPATPPGAR